MLQDDLNDPDSPQARASDLRAGIERRLTSLESHAIPQLAAGSTNLQLHADLVDEIRQDAQTIDAQLEVGCWASLTCVSVRLTLPLGFLGAGSTGRRSFFRKPACLYPPGCRLSLG